MANEQLTIQPNDARMTVIGKSWPDQASDSGGGDWDDTYNGTYSGPIPRTDLPDEIRIIEKPIRSVGRFNRDEFVVQAYKGGDIWDGSSFGYTNGIIPTNELQFGIRKKQGLKLYFFSTCLYREEYVFYDHQGYVLIGDPSYTKVDLIPYVVDTECTVKFWETVKKYTRGRYDGVYSVNGTLTITPAYMKGETLKTFFIRTRRENNGAFYSQYFFELGGTGKGHYPIDSSSYYRSAYKTDLEANILWTSWYGYQEQSSVSEHHSYELDFNGYWWNSAGKPQFFEGEVGSTTVPSNRSNLFPIRFSDLYSNVKTYPKTGTEYYQDQYCIFDVPFFDIDPDEAASHNMSVDLVTERLCRDIIHGDNSQPDGGINENELYYVAAVTVYWQRAGDGQQLQATTNIGMKDE